MRTLAYTLTILMLISTIPNTFVEEVNADSGRTGYSVNSGSYYTLSLGNIDSGKELEIDYSADDNIDVLLMTSAQYNSWQSGSSTHTESGSDYDDNSDSYVFTTLSSDSYYLTFDNSNQGGEASATGGTVSVDSTVVVVNSSNDKVRTRAWVDSDSYQNIAIGSVDSGKVLSFDVDCDIGLTSGDDLDFLLMDSIQANSLQSSTWTWNRHSSFEDTCSHSWEYETGVDSGWNLVIENGNKARTSGLSNGVMVDVIIDTRSLLSLVEITDTSRMIDSGDYYRVDTGFIPAGGVIDIDYSFWSHGTAMLTDDLDILVMDSSEADKYELSNDAITLGHTTALDVGGESWSYQFPNAGSYSIIFDNTDEPSGGAGDGSDVQTEIGVTSLTIPSLFGNLWTGWHQSRHYADEGDYMALDLGNLNSGDDVYYYADGNNEGGSIWSSKEYDILFMSKDNYDLYVNGSTFNIIADGTNYKEDGIIPVIENISVPSNSHYMLVFDAADGPDSSSADANGDWIWEFIVLSDGGTISNLQAEDNQYEVSISVGTITPPDEDNDGIRNGVDECPSTINGANVDSKGCASSQMDSDGDGVANNVDQCPNTPVGDNVDSTGCTEQTDSDGDGVADNNDQCPNTPASENVDSNGCSDSQLDSDGDGVANNVDQCPNTPASENVDSNGCSDSQLDSDGDGVANNVDQCPNTPAGDNVDSTGCTEQSDSDGDGVADNADQCPNTPSGEIVGSDGCSDSQTDADGDGVADNADQCPNTPAGDNVDSTGCTEQSDSDGDGVADNADQCPNTPSGEMVGSDGCSDSQTDADGDGVADNVDQCPNTPAGDNVDSAGCTEQSDSDGDGVADNNDQCPNTPSGEVVGSDGCSDSQTDADADGVADNVDQCPNTPASENADSSGCSDSQLDSDGDGVADNADQCPNTPAGDNVDSTGCTEQTDSDGDGVADNVDQCPYTPTSENAGSNGCSDSQLDSDGDGIGNNVDQCPNTPAGNNVDSTGCTEQTDSDGDGVAEESEGMPGFSSMLAVIALAGAAICFRNRD